MKLTPLISHPLPVIAAMTFFVTFSFGQNDATYFSSQNGIQYGYGVKVQADLSTVEKFAFRLCVSGGIGGFAGNNWFYPSLNADVMIFRCGMGSARPGPFEKNWFDLEAVLNYTFTFGSQNRLTENSPVNPKLRDYPLYYFNTWSNPVLQQPYRYSASWGGNIVFLATAKHIQLVGFANIHIDRFQANYANDGPPFFPPFGDRFDRFHTGAGYLTWHDERLGIDRIEVGYNKFTGFNADAYELSNKLGANYVFYDMTQNYYNKSNFYFNFSSIAQRWGASFVFENQPALDFQHRIHLSRYFPLHLVPYESGFSVGAIGYYRNTKIGLE